jgi:hypothetical protein
MFMATTETRKPCPHCDEMIISGAKKCKYCKEKLDSDFIDKKTNSVNKEKKLTFFKFVYSIWLLSLLLFISQIIWSSESFTNFTEYIILGGMISFLFMVIDLHKNRKSNKSHKYARITFITLLGFFLTTGTVIGLGISGNKSYTVAPAQENYVRPTIRPTTTPAKQLQKGTQQQQTQQVNKVNCIGPDGKEFQTTQQECDNFNTAWGNPPTPDPNEYIKCNISTNCGGGYKEMTRSSCENITCCQINNSWELRERSQCSSEQKQQADSEWIQYCNRTNNPDDCSSFWETGSYELFNCRAEAYGRRVSCINNK